MRFVRAAALALAAFGAIASLPQQARAFGWEKEHAPSDWGVQRTIHHHVYHPRYQHVYHVNAEADPYAYKYAHRGYYPYYASKYWVPAHEMRARNAQIYSGPKYKYYQAWGYPKKDYDHVQWHKDNHGFHHRWHW
jgi:hypothetical protein